LKREIDSIKLAVEKGFEDIKLFLAHKGPEAKRGSPLGDSADEKEEVKASETKPPKKDGKAPVKSAPAKSATTPTKPTADKSNPKTPTKVPSTPPSTKKSTPAKK